MWNRAKTAIIIIILVAVAVSSTVYFSFYLKAMINQKRAVGVDVGNKFRYNVTTTSWGAYHSNLTILSPHEDEEWVEVSITDVSGTNITGIITVHYYDGTEIALDNWKDVATGDGGTNSSFGLWDIFLFRLISPNLTAGDTLYNSSITDVWASTSVIDETVRITYPSGVVRETNHLNDTREERQAVVHAPMWVANVTRNWYWDKSTGVVANYSEQWLYYYLFGEYANQWQYESWEYRIISSDLWAVS